MAYNLQSVYPYSMNYNAYQQPQQQYTAQPNMSYQAQQQPVGIIWVDGEVGAKAYQLPVNWPVNAPMPLWDTNDTVIYLKSINQMGMPNPLQKIHYTMEEAKPSPMLGQSAQAQPALPEHTDYVTKDDLEHLKDELKEAMTELKAVKSNGKSAV